MSNATQQEPENEPHRETNTNPVPVTPCVQQFRTLYQALNQPQGLLLEIRVMRPNQKGMNQEFYPTLDEALAALTPEGLATHHIFFGVSPRIAPNGTKAAVRQVPCLWADLDGHGYAEGKQEAFDRLKAFQYPPTVTVDSGNGYHAYWTLDEAFQIHGESDIRDIEGILAGLIAQLGADPACKDITRILRVPGSLNVKDPANPKLVQIVECDPSRRYSVSDFRQFVKPRSTSAVTDWNLETMPRTDVAGLLDGIAEGNRRTTFLKVAGKLLGQGWSDKDAMNLLTPHSQRVNFPMDELEGLISDLYRKEQGRPALHFLDEEVLLPTTGSLASTSFTSSAYVIGGSEKEGSSELALVAFNNLLTTVPKDVDWRVTGLFPVQGVGVIAGEPGVGKSWLAMDMALAVATNRPWMGQYATKTCPVLYVDLENSPNLLSRRFNKLVAAQKLDPATVTNFQVHQGEGLALDTLQGFQRLGRAIEKTGAKFIVLDSLTRLHTGDENTVKDMSKVSRTLLGLAAHFQACIIVIDHLGKASNGLRGSTEKKAMPETIIEAEGFSDQDNIMKLKVTKLRATGEKPEPFLVQLKDIGPEATVVRIVHPESDDDGEIGRDMDMEWVLETVERHGGKMPRPDLEREAKAVKKWGQKKVSAILGRGIESGKLKAWSEVSSKTKRLHSVVEVIKEVPNDSKPNGQSYFSFFDEEETTVN